MTTRSQRLSHRISLVHAMKDHYSPQARFGQLLRNPSPFSPIV